MDDSKLVSFDEETNEENISCNEEEGEVFEEDSEDFKGDCDPPSILVSFDQTFDTGKCQFWKAF